MTAPAALGKDYGFSFRPQEGTGTDSGAKWRMQRAAKRLLPENGRFLACNHNPKKRAHGVAVYTRDDSAWLSGVYQCGSVWICPICARRVAEARREEIQTAINNAIRRGWGVALVTLTFPHGAGDVLTDILEKFTKAQSDFKSGRAAAAVRSGIGYVGEIRTLEVTHGAHGFHPHTHSIWISEKQLTPEEGAALETQLFDHWLAACIKNGLPPPVREHGVDVRVARHDVADYVSKWGFAAELAGGVSKRGKNGSRNPWQLLADAANGDKNAARLWRIFALAFFGKRQLFWSKRKTGKKIRVPIFEAGPLTGKRVKVGERVRDEWISLRAELGLAPELTEQQILDLDDKRPERVMVALLDLDTWHVVRKSEAQGEVLHLAMTDRVGLFALLNRLRATVPIEDGRPPGVREDWEL